MVEIPEAFIANCKLSFKFNFLSNAEASAPLNASPAPVVSTTFPFRFKAGTEKFSFSLEK